MASSFSKTSPEYISIVTASHIQGLEDDLVIFELRIQGKILHFPQSSPILMQNNIHFESVPEEKC